MKDEVAVAVVKVISPVDFEALLDPEENACMGEDFLTFSEKLNSYYCQYDILCESKWVPSRNQLVVGRHPKDRRWYRGVVKSIIERSHGYNVHLYGVDTAEDLIVPISNIRALHRAFTEFPFQAVRLKLPYLSPKSLILKDDMSVEIRVTNKWDTSAYEFVRCLTRQHKTVFKTVQRGRCGSLMGELHFIMDGKRMCLNELLIKHNFAVKEVVDDSASLSFDECDSVVGSDDSVPVGATASNYSWPSSSNSCSTPATHQTPSRSPINIDEEWRDLNITLQKKLDDLIFGSGKIVANKPRKVNVEDQSPNCSLPLAYGVNEENRNSPSDRISSLSSETSRHLVLSDYIPHTTKDSSGMSHLNHKCADQHINTSTGNHDRSSSKSKTSENLSSVEKLKVNMLETILHSSKNSNLHSDTNVINAHLKPPCQSPSGVLMIDYDNRNLSNINQESISAIADTKSANGMNYESDSTTLSISKKKLLLKRLTTRPSALTSYDKSKGNEERPTSADIFMTNCSEGDLGDVSSRSSMESQVCLQLPTSSLNHGEASKDDSSVLLKEFLRKHASKSTINNGHTAVEHSISPCRPGSSSTITKIIETLPTRNKLHFFESSTRNPYFSTSMDDPLGITETVSGRNILVCGQAAPKPCTGLTLSFQPFVLESFKRMNILVPSVIQSYVWPAVLRGRSFVAVSCPHSGKTLAYLCPLLTLLFEKSQYLDLPSGNEPIVLILTTSWKTASHIYDQCKAILRNNHFVSVLLLHGGGHDETQKISLWNGCDILIATPCALVRLLKGEGLKPLSLNRLCHLVLDDADILIDQFTDQVKQMLAEYENVLKKRSPTIPYQIMAFSSKWTLGLKSLFCNIMLNPLLYCSSFCESVVIAGVKTTCTVFEESNKLQKMLDMLQPLIERNDERIVICTCDAISATQLFKSLNRSPWLLLATESMSQCEVLGVRNMWHQYHPVNQKPVLIVSDPCLEELNIENADHLIHYDIPEMSKSQFGLRFSCLLSHMKKVNSLSEDSSLMTDCRTQIVITEKCRLQAHALIKLLTRLSSYIPPQLFSLALGLYQASEENKELFSLCHYIKAFGRCPKQYWCSRRHILTKSMDSPSTTILRGSVVKVYIIDVRNAAHFYGRIIEYQAEDGKWVPSHLNNLALLLDLNAHFANPVNRRCQNQPKIGEICAIVGKDSSFYRVRILSRPHRKGSNSLQVRVILIDLGMLSYVEVAELLILPPNFTSVPSIAVEMFLCNVRPVDMDQEWTPLACEHVTTLISGQEMLGKVALSLGNTLWLSSLMKTTTLQCSNVVVKNFELKEALLKKKLAIDNPTHLESLEAFAKKTLNLGPADELPQIQPLPNSLDRSKNLSYLKLQPEFAYLKLGEFHDVCLSEVFTPDKFFVTRSDFKKCLDELMDDIQEYVKTNPSRCQQFDEGMLCVAKFSKDNEYYRGRIISAPNEAGIVHVFFVDYGYEEEVATTDIYQLVKALIWKLPFQAIACSLADVIPVDGTSGWCKEAGDYLWEESSTESGVAKVFAIKALKKTGEIDPKTGVHFYEVQLFDGTYVNADAQIARRLWNLGYAKLVNENGGQEDVKTVINVNQKEDKAISKGNDIKEIHNEESNKLLRCDEKKIVPFVCWVDFKSSIELKLKIDKVKQHSFKITSQNLHYETTVNSVIYELDIDLFSAVDGEKSTVHIKENCVLITLIKFVSMLWPRLLKQTMKPFWLTVNYDKFDCDEYDSDSPPVIDWQRPCSTTTKEDESNQICKYRREKNRDKCEEESQSSVSRRHLSSSTEKSYDSQSDCDDDDDDEYAIFS